jgi:hypothetical protein
MKARRKLLVVPMLVGMLLCPVVYSVRGQNPETPYPQEPRPGTEPAEAPNPDLPNARKKILEDNDKDMKKKVERLYQLASELKEQVNKTDSSKVLSLDLMKKAEEIERLARDIKNHSRG